MNTEHKYNLTIKWTGNTGKGTSNYSTYERSHSILVNQKVPILGSSDPAFRGDKTKHNPEELFIASASACHMLWYLHLCSVANIVVVEYVDNAYGRMVETAKKGGKFIEINLNPIVTVTQNSMKTQAIDLHQKANELCFIANSVNFPITHNPICNIKSNNS